MDTFALIFSLAVIVEALIEYLGDPIPSRYKHYASAAVGVVLCVVYQADILALLGYAAILPYVGSVLTGLIIGRGSNYLNDLVSRLVPSRPEPVRRYLPPDTDHDMAAIFGPATNSEPTGDVGN